MTSGVGVQLLEPALAAGRGRAENDSIPVDAGAEMSSQYGVGWGQMQAETGGRRGRPLNRITEKRPGRCRSRPGQRSVLRLQPLRRWSRSSS